MQVQDGGGQVKELLVCRLPRLDCQDVAALPRQRAVELFFRRESADGFFWKIYHQ